MPQVDIPFAQKTTGCRISSSKVHVKAQNPKPVALQSQKEKIAQDRIHNNSEVDYLTHARRKFGVATGRSSAMENKQAADWIGSVENSLTGTTNGRSLLSRAEDNTLMGKSVHSNVQKQLESSKTNYSDFNGPALTHTSADDSVTTERAFEGRIKNPTSEKLHSTVIEKPADILTPVIDLQLIVVSISSQPPLTREDIAAPTTQYISTPVAIINTIPTNSTQAREINSINNSTNNFQINYVTNQFNTIAMDVQDKDSRASHCVAFRNSSHSRFY
jgi:hypothetical protein